MFLSLVAEAESARYIYGTFDTRGTPIRTWRCTGCERFHTERYVLHGMVGRAFDWVAKVQLEHEQALARAYASR
jgi:hypothetical protein